MDIDHRQIEALKAWLRWLARPRPAMRSEAEENDRLRSRATLDYIEQLERRDERVRQPY